jgi:hypothetical protein
MNAGYVLRRLAEKWNDPHWVRHNFLTEVVSPIHQLGYGDPGTPVLDHKWDNLLVLDACRADLFEERVDLDRFDEYSRVTSNASNTTPWTRKNFGDRELGDTVYVSANPVTSKEAPKSFHELREVWADHFDPESYSILPEPVVEEAKRAHEDHPDKRLVTHFVQPHMPFVPRPELIFRTHWRPGETTGPDGEDPQNIWHALELGEVTRAETWDAYGDTLDFVIDHAVELAEHLPGRSVIMSDHGNMLGERTFPPVRVYGHPPGLRCPELVEVPWAVIDDGTERQFTDDGAHSDTTMGEDVVRERLHNLGYVE